MTESPKYPVEWRGVLITLLLVGIVAVALILLVGCAGRSVQAEYTQPVVRTAAWYDLAEMAETIGAAYFGKRPPTAKEYGDALSKLETAVSPPAKTLAKPRANEPAVKKNAAEAFKELE